MKQYPLLIGLGCLLLVGLWMFLASRRQKVLFYEIPEDDEQMKQASQQARDTLDKFIQALAAPASGQHGFSIKGRFQRDVVVENIWLDDPTYDGFQFTGIVGNDPVHISDLKAGQTVRVQKTEISDWMFVERGTLQGGFTIRLHYSRQPAGTRNELVKRLPFKIPELDPGNDGGDV